MNGKAYLLANHHEFVLGELVVPPSVSFLAITNERGLFIQERVDDGCYSGDPRGRFLPVCKYCLQLCGRQGDQYCCQECFGPAVKGLLKAMGKI